MSDAQDAHLILAGTSGGPPPRRGRRGICTALSVGGRTYLVDVGRSAVDQLFDAGVNCDEVGAIFVTHMHSDHISDLYNFFWLNWGWPDGGVAGLSHQVGVYGPGQIPEGAQAAGSAGLADFFAQMAAATAADVNIRIADEGKDPIDSLYRVTELDPPTTARATPFAVMEDDRVRVSAVLVEHPPVEPSYAYRIDSDAGSAVVSGDTTICPQVGELAAGADVLCHEALDVESLTRRGVSSDLLAHLVDSHSDSTRLGQLAQAAGVPHLVLHHLVPGDPAMVDDDTWRAKASRGYSGRVTVAHDLDRLRIRS